MPRRYPLGLPPKLRTAPIHLPSGAASTLAAVALAAVMTLLVPLGAAAGAPPAADPEPSALQAPIPPGAVIGEVRIVNGDIFDPHRPGEDRWLFRTANRIHRETRAPVIERQLLFKSGDPYRPERLTESERLLRQNNYLYDAHIRPVAVHDGRVDVEVVTRDVWTLQAGVSYGHVGGHDSSSFEIQDSNVLGTGKEVSLLHLTDVDRTSNVVRFTDPNLLGSRARMELAYADNSDGRRGRFSLERPFFSLDTRWSLGLRGQRDSRDLALYQLGKAYDTFRREQDFFELQGGLSPGLVDGHSNRFRFGFSYEKDTFSTTVGTQFKRTSLPLPRKEPLLPPGRTLAFPWIAYDRVSDGYIEEHDRSRIERTEDLNLGTQAHVRIGWSSPLFGGDVPRWIGDASGSTGWRPTPGQLLFTSAGVSTRWANVGAENLIASARLGYSVRDLGSNLFYAALTGDMVHHADRETQLLLGGDEGLRGYPIRYQAGDRRVLLTIEQRFYSDREIFHLAHLGAAVFFDAGQAWFLESLAIQERKILRDIGAGLRIASSRSSGGAVIHLDVAYPLDRGHGIDGIQWLVSTKESF
jgi:hypothetical protein